MAVTKAKRSAAGTQAKGPDKRALVTGASSGIGEGFARQLAARGYDIVLVARRRDRLEKVAAQLTAEHRISCEALDADLSQPEAIAAVEKRLRQGDIRMLVNCAGFGTQGPFAGLPLDKELEEIEVNIRALTRLSHAALEMMMPKKRGTIINVASTGAFQPVPHMATYAATKAYVLSFSEALHEEAKPHGIKVTCLCPGPVKTEFQQVAGVDQSRLRVGWTDVDSVVKAALRGAARGQAIVVPGMMNQAGVTASKFMPRFITRKVAGAIFERSGGIQ